MTFAQSHFAGFQVAKAVDSFVFSGRSERVFDSGVRPSGRWQEPRQPQTPQTLLVRLVHFLCTVVATSDVLGSKNAHFDFLHVFLASSVQF